jgi:putative PIN family toxin of toxin-antitoxin system
MRAALDSNVLASALYSAGGPAEEVVRRLCAPTHVLVVSAFLLAELRRVLHYPRLRQVHGFDDEQIERAVAALETAALYIDVTETDVIRIVPHDPDDDHIVALAVAGKVNVLCTRNRHLFNASVVAYCRQSDVEILDDIELIGRLRADKPGSTSR